ncbi:uncharacterized protein MONBRDRAFT_29825 [Monosiga brevicollis MX1]|uniref:Peptidase C14 caspase domain-containing protein n=1 Tax=Monosiga brevicollis TaxID=81824 RepID=A9VC84_MONBE|nr:uncharacterized protein MONBRDRAFT_29825 [Monosiga brevicollis MX1]EDQ84855.1 predicted protein [Monosiga brevicollis MX1]|eukprot:XP_001750356.1 hypothetical protein [Monosiga brevicollis MX1]
MAKKALLVGCNYPGTQAQLNGCVNDVWSMHTILTDLKVKVALSPGALGFSKSDITVMIDTDSRDASPTGRNIKAGLNELVRSSKAGDYLVFHFSGHGTQIPAEGDTNEADGKDEAICPTDLNIIIDDDLREIVEQLPSGANLTVVTDCCHSGSMLDHTAVQIQGNKGGSSQIPGLMDVMGAAMGRGLEATPREIPLDMLANMLSQQTGHTVRPGNIRYHLANIFGADASTTALNFLRAVQQHTDQNSMCGQGLLHLIRCLRAGGVGMERAVTEYHDVCRTAKYGGSSGGNSLGIPGLSSNFTAPTQGQKPPPEQQLSSDKGILITGCQAHETSADACPSGDRSRAFGALTNAIATVLRHRPNASYYDVVSEVRKHLLQGGFKQNPCLECDDRYKDMPFICPA